MNVLRTILVKGERPGLATGLAIAAGLTIAVPAASRAQVSATFEVPYLASAVAAGKLPSMRDRLPSSPRVIDPRKSGGTIGIHGGHMRWLMGKPKDTRMVAYYGYARLVAYNEKYDLVPDILEKYEVEEGRIFTFYLRPGHKWSDGHPFTAEDFRYVWEDLYNDKRMGKSIPAVMLVKGKPPVFEVLSETTVRYTWQQANPQFLSALAGTLPLVITMPFHYVKQYHPRYADPEELAEKVKAARVSKPKSLHKKMTRGIEFKNKDLPVLSPWYNTTAQPSNLFIYKRNPYFHRVDPEGRQLPYIDEIHMSIGSPSLIPAKTGSGDSDLQARYLRFDDYTFLKAAERKGKIKVYLWEKANGSHMAIVPNLTTKDDTWRKLLRDKRMRRALSLGINRKEINAAIFYGLARESGDTLLPRSPLYRDAYAHKWIKFDIAEANRLLDELGLEKRGFDGIRKLPDGRRAEIILDTAGESTEQTDVLSLIQDSWRRIGLAMFPRPTQRDLFRNRVYSGDAIMSVWSGHNNGLADPGTNPEFLAPVSQAQLQWPDWGLHAESGGKKGTPPDLPAARKLVSLLGDWRRSTSDTEQARIWHEMLDIYSDNLFTIGILNGTKQPIATAPNMRNVPSDGVFSFDPGGYFGVYHPDTFYYAPAKSADASGVAKGR